MPHKDAFVRLSTKLAVVSALGYVSYLLAKLALRKISAEREETRDFTTRHQSWTDADASRDGHPSGNESEWLTMDEDDSEELHIDYSVYPDSPADESGEDMDQNMLTMALMELLKEGGDRPTAKSRRAGPSRRKRAPNARPARRTGQTLEKKATVQEMQMLYDALSMLDADELSGSPADPTSRMEIIDSDDPQEEM